MTRGELHDRTAGWARRLLALLMLLAPQARAALAQSAAAPDGAEAPEGHWYTRAGCASRSGRTLTRAPRSAPPLTWKASFPHELVGEPLAWDDRVLLETTRSLYGIDRATGALLFQRDAPPTPDWRFQATLYGPAIVCRGEGDTLDCLRWRARTVESMFALSFASPPRSWLLYENELYVLLDGALQRFELGELTPRWSTRGVFFGEIALRGDALYVAGHDNGRAAYLNVFDRASGALRKSWLAGYYAEETPHPASYPTLCVGTANVLLRHTAPVATTKGNANWTDVDVEQGQDPRMLQLLTSPALTRDGWIAFLTEPTSRRRTLVQFVEDQDGLRELSAKDHHAEFSRFLVPISIAGSIACLGTAAFDVESQRALWRIDGAAALRTVPVRDGVLVVPDAKTLHAHIVRSGARAPAAEPVIARAPFAPATAGDGASADAPAAARDDSVPRALACFGDGALVEGELRYKPDTGKVWSAALKKALPLAELAYAEDRDGRVLFLRRAEESFAFANAALERRAARQYAELAAKAVAANGAELARTCASAARRLGAGGKELDALDKRITAIGAKKPSAKALEELDARLRELESSRVPALVARFEALPASFSFEARQPWLRELLALDPAQPQAQACVRAGLPDGFAPGGSFDARGWLEFVRSRPRETMQTVQLVPDGKPKVDTPAWGLALARSVAPENRRRWRADIQAVGGDNLYVLSPMTDPEALRACWSTSELVSRCLESIFGGVRTGDMAARPLELRLYESKTEYMSHGFERMGEASRGLAWTAGHYDPLQNITHVYFPDDVPHEAVLPVVAHEVVHHWIQARCPGFADRTSSQRALGNAGFWIVEGFANMVEEFEWDLDAGTWSSPSSVADSPAIVAQLEAEALWPWPQLVALSKVEFNALKMREVAAVAAPSWLGRQRALSNVAIFYAQAGTLASYLYHADGGRLRPQLLQYLATFYDARSDERSFERAFGATAATLGEKATQWARELTQSQSK